MFEKRVDKTHTEFELLVMSSGFKPEEAMDYLGLMRLAVTTERIADAATRIVDVVLRGLEPHPVIRLVIEEAEETVTRLQVSSTSPLVGKTLRDAKIPAETGMWILVIRRGRKRIRPKPNTVIQAGDILIASGYAEEEDLTQLASGQP